MQSRRVTKEYHAIVWGWPDWETKSVDAPIVRQGAIGTSKIYLKQMIDPAWRRSGDKISRGKTFPKTNAKR